MTTKFKYNYDRRSKWIGCISVAVIVAVFVLIYIFSGQYIYAWILSLFVALLALCALSIPRFVVVTKDALEIHCVVELTRIEINEIAIIRKVSKNEYRHQLFLALGSYGFFGYYGYYFNARRWDFIKLYATERKHLVEIEDIYEQRYIISCRKSDLLIELVMQAKLATQEHV